MTKQVQKRESRQMSDVQKEKISAALKGRKLTNQTKQKISSSMTKYWASIPSKPITDNNPDLPKNNIYKDSFDNGNQL